MFFIFSASQSSDPDCASPEVVGNEIMSAIYVNPNKGRVHNVSTKYAPKLNICSPSRANVGKYNNVKI